MRAELPWNVAGIPPEAREAARAAARREGLSVGEWLTRRILRSFSGMEEDMPISYESRAHTGAPLDSWGLPPSAASRRDTEEMMARVGRSENESNEAWRRIEDQLRGLGRRLDSSERSHGESNRVLSRTAQEMNIAAREQAQAFDQLGLNVMSLNERLERLERSAAHDGIKDAVKALHQGLSRLADQITATANNSASQVVTLTSNLEQLAGRVGQMRVDSEIADKALDARIDSSERAVAARLDAGERAAEERIEAAERSVEARLASLDGRLGSAEKSTQFNTNALDHALEKIEASANQRATDQVENQKRSAQHEESLNRLEDSIARLEMRLPDAEFERRLDGIERSVNGMADRLETYDPTAKFDTSMQAISYRIEALEKDHADLLSELRAKVLRPVEPPPYEASAREKPAPAAFEAPPFAEPPAYEPPAHEPPPFPAFGNEPAGDFAAPTTPHGFSFDIPPDTSDPFAPPPDFADVFADTPQPENFLAQARRSARAASEKAETERRGHFTGLWGKDGAEAVEAEEKPKPRYLIPLLVVLVVVVLAAVALLLNQHARQNTIVANKVAPATPAAPPASKAPFVVAPQAGAPATKALAAKAPAQTIHAAPHVATAQHAPELPPRTTGPLAQHTVTPSPIKPVLEAARPASVTPAQDKIIQLANTGNPAALTILGLRALDGTNGTPVNLAEAVKFLSQAAEKGQAVAQYRLGTLYERGQGVPADPVKAAHWYEMAANQGNRKAMHNLAVAYASGTAGKKNMPEAARWFAKAAALGLADSQFNLAVLYERGDGVPQSLLDAFKWYSIAAASGDSESKSRMGVLQTQLSDSDKAAANKSAATFHAAPLNRAANVPPEPADLGN
jgi:localization factor PodJL